MPKGKLTPKKSTHKTVKKSRTNTSGAPSAAKREAAKRSAKTKPQAKKPAAKKTTNRVSKGTPYVRSGLNPQQPRQLPETEKTRRGLTLRKLFRNTPRLMINNAMDVNVIKFKVTKTRSGMPAIQAVTLTDDPWRPNRTKRPRDTFIIGLDVDKQGEKDINKPVNAHKRVIVSCSCEDYMFRWEYANAAHGASRIIYGNGDPPEYTNPLLAYGLCKHLVALAKKIIKEDK